MQCKQRCAHQLYWNAAASYTGNQIPDSEHAHIAQHPDRYSFLLINHAQMGVIRVGDRVHGCTRSQTSKFGDFMPRKWMPCLRFVQALQCHSLIPCADHASDWQITWDTCCHLCFCEWQSFHSPKPKPCWPSLATLERGSMHSFCKKLHPVALRQRRHGAEE